MVEFEFDAEKMKAGVHSFLWCDNEIVNQRNQDLNPASATHSWAVKVKV
jgi:hypothetical protein